jgi:hypothetical protein
VSLTTWFIYVLRSYGVSGKIVNVVQALIAVYEQKFSQEWMPDKPKYDPILNVLGKCLAGFMRHARARGSVLQQVEEPETSDSV